jgi:phenylpropionate dioxygenase-like ring-hydroxylating dioxygenase large terminal subunit
MRASARSDYDKLVRRDRVHGRLYLEPEIFAEELEKIFERGWVYVGHSREIPEPGDFRLGRIGRQPVIMVRDQEGRVQLLLNRCRHRGATVCQHERGNGKAFRCSYHGWSYRLSGELMGAPYPDAYDDSFRREEMGLVKVPRVDSYRGFIFGSLSPDGISLDEHLGRAKEQIDLFVGLSDEDEIEVCSTADKYSFRANWKLGIENAMDSYHVGFTHASFMGVLQERIMSAARPEGLDFDPAGYAQGSLHDLGGGHALLDLDIYDRANGNSLPKYVPLNGDPLPAAVSASTPRGRAHLEQLQTRFGVERTKNMLREGATHALVFPNLVLLGVQMRVFQPIAVDHTEVYLYTTLLSWLSPEVNAVRLRSHEAFFGPASFGGPDDSEIFERIMEGLRADVEPWILLARGLNRERAVDGTRVGDLTDETSQRGIWAQWKKVMTARGGRKLSTRRSARLGGTSASI